MQFEGLRTIHQRANESFIGRTALRSATMGISMLAMDGFILLTTGHTAPLLPDTVFGAVMSNVLINPRQSENPEQV